MQIFNFQRAWPNSMLALVLVFFMSGVFAQNPYEIKSNNSYSGLESKSVLKYTDNASVMVTLNKLDFSRSLKVLDERKNVVFETKTNSNQFVIENLEYDKKYTLLYTDGVIGEELTEDISVSSKNPSALNVPKKVFDVVSEFSAQSRLDIGDFLMNQKAISTFEAYSFIQQYTSGNVLPSKGRESKEGNISTDLTLDVRSRLVIPRPPEAECFCKVISTQFATPTGSPILAPNGNINTTTPIIKDPKGEFNNRASWWHYRYHIGPAKAHMIWTEGRKSWGNNWDHEFSNFTGGSTSPGYAEVAYNLLCLDRQGRPNEGCDCSKDVTIQYQYDVKAETFTNIKEGASNGIGDKDAEAVDEDMALIVEKDYNNGETNVIDANMVSVGNQCSSSINGQWFVDLLEALAVVAQVVITNNVTAGNIDDFVDAASDLITTNIIERTGSCGIISDNAGLLNNGYTKTLQPNNPMYYELHSFSNQKVGGKRGWDSHAFNVSDFLLAGVVVPSDDKEDCCIDGLANWVFASAWGSPTNNDNLNRIVGTFISINWPFFDLPVEPFTNAFIMPTQIGFVEDVICTRGGVIFEHEVKIRDSAETDLEFLSLNATSGIEVMDLSNSEITKLDAMKQDLQVRMGDLPGGVYIIRYLERGLPKAEKIFLTK